MEGKIPRKSIQQYKANLALLHGRYGEFERRLLEQFAQTNSSSVQLNTGRELDLYYLLRDGHLTARADSGGMFIGGMPVAQLVTYSLTSSGQALVKRMKAGSPLS
ncbi:hypothetical protein [Frigoribacterium faeni]|uniref:Uncharacterized protein n=1 Tax=Frigoribacterium faeni TaxID=145483 RepID=A0A7W3PIF1_9MICO|nr:hypothetical protein [Frigoribacterium faeni]MBA8812682.1 hypothetical protein [Frigoribacterium faeni]